MKISSSNFHNFILNLFIKICIFSIVFFNFSMISAKSNSISQKLKLPFSLLNQYFEYFVEKDGKVNLSDKAFYLNKVLYYNQNMNVYQIDPDFLNLFKNSKIFVNYISQYPISIDYNLNKSINSSLNLIPSGNSMGLCLIIQNEFTTLELCISRKPISIVELNAPKVKIDNQSVDASGMVILNVDNERLGLNIDFNEQNYIHLKTEKKFFNLVNLKKDIQEEELKARFLISKNKKNWDEKLSLTSDSFKIPYDEIITLNQDYLITDLNFKNTNYDYEYKDPPSLFKVSTQRYGVEPTLYYSSLTSQNAQDFLVNLNSDMGKGIKLFYQNDVGKTQQNFYSFLFFVTSIQNDVQNQTILNKYHIPYQLSYMRKFLYSNNLSLGLGTFIQENLFFTDSATSEATELFTAVNSGLSAFVDYKIYNQQKIEVTIPFEAKVLQPVVQGKSKVNTGFSFELGIKGSYQLGWGRFSLGISYGERFQNSEEIQLKEQFFNYNAGYIYLF